MFLQKQLATHNAWVVHGHWLVPVCVRLRRMPQLVAARRAKQSCVFPNLSLPLTHIIGLGFLWYVSTQIESGKETKESIGIDQVKASQLWAALTGTLIFLIGCSTLLGINSAPLGILCFLLFF